MSFSRSLVQLEDPHEYPGPHATSRRWGQILREVPDVTAILRHGQETGLLKPLRELATLRGGVVTRANAYFIVRELPFDEIPKGARVTKRDLTRISVVMDGLEALHKIEKAYLRPIVKGPESLISPATVEMSDLRLFVVDDSREELKKARANGALEYLRRGETVSYNVSSDNLKGGIPAKRSQIKNRRPFWYSLSVPEVNGPRIILPEHIDRRYIATILDNSDTSVVIDKLFIAEPYKSEDTKILLASLNSLLSWYQMELRGRTQLGEGVLEVKKTDLGGILVLNPEDLSPKSRKQLLEAFSPLADAEHRDSLEVVSEPERVNFDELYLKLIGRKKVDEDRILVERELRAAVAERAERRASVAEAKIERRRTTTTEGTIEAYAARLAASIEPYPDPREHLSETTSTWPVPITGKIEGQVTIGTALFNQGVVFSGETKIAEAADVPSATYVQAVLTREPHLTQVFVPLEPDLKRIMAAWKDKINEWEKRFESTSSEIISGIQDKRLKQSIILRARALLHAV